MPKVKFDLKPNATRKHGACLPRYYSQHNYTRHHRRPNPRFLQVSVHSAKSAVICEEKQHGD